MQPTSTRDTQPTSSHYDQPTSTHYDQPTSTHYDQPTSTRDTQPTSTRDTQTTSTRDTQTTCSCGPDFSADQILRQQHHVPANSARPPSLSTLAHSRHDSPSLSTIAHSRHDYLQETLDVLSDETLYLPFTEMRNALADEMLNMLYDETLNEPTNGATIVCPLAEALPPWCLLVHRRRCA
ncbi:uncharacterized protein SCHCODRAFT_02504762 [Schizophyllum commune H4-8]|nr:uncharacterized protein SCHCODRAFT_02504762 [Schizophyllum commune H4-8]KAI5891673.1 hypothetical protein SCHCODRAFT_02504762 [Schizophyllum commune H4-8]